jgi:hypothetical protein
VANCAGKENKGQEHHKLPSAEAFQGFEEMRTADANTATGFYNFYEEVHACIS